MELILTDDEARLLRDVLSDGLHELRLEVARTEAKEFRHSLVVRQEFMERVLVQLEREVRTGPPSSTARKSS